MSRLVRVCAPICIAVLTAMAPSGCGLDGPEPRDETFVLGDNALADIESPAMEERMRASIAGIESELAERGFGSVASGSGSAFSLVKAAHADTTRRQLVRHADLHVRVESVDSAIVTIVRIAAGNGGYVSSEESREHADGRVTGRVVLRVLAHRTDGALVQIRALGEVRNERVWADDVTDQFYDLNIRLTNARAARRKFEEILVRAREVEDVLKVQRELNRVNNQIDRMTGRMRRMSNQIRLSTISVDLAEPMPITRDPDSAVGALSRALGDMVDAFWATIGGMIVFVGFIVPFGVAVFLAIWLVVRLTRPWRLRRREKRKAVAT